MTNITRTGDNQEILSTTLGISYFCLTEPQVFDKSALSNEKAPSRCGGSEVSQGEAPSANRAERSSPGKGERVSLLGTRFAASGQQSAFGGFAGQRPLVPQASACGSAQKRTAPPDFGPTGQ